MSPGEAGSSNWLVRQCRDLISPDTCLLQTLVGGKQRSRPALSEMMALGLCASLNCSQMLLNWDFRSHVQNVPLFCVFSV